MTRRRITNFDDFSEPFQDRISQREQDKRLLDKIGEYTIGEVRDMHRTMLEQDRLLERLTKAAIEYGRVIDFDNDSPVVLTGGRAVKVEASDTYQVELGQWVVCSEDTKQIVGLSDRNYTGELVTVSRVIDFRRVEVGSITGSRVMLQPGSAQVGDEWLAMPDANVLVQKIERPVQQMQTDYEPVYWGSIGGLTEVKKELIETIALLRHDLSRFSSFYQVKQPKGVLLYGPPGNGKTLLGRAVATELSGDATQFIYIKGPEILSKFVGMSEERIKNLFLRARKCHEQTGRAAVIFIDECDAIMNARGTGRSSDVERTIVPAFLTEMDGLERNHAFVMLATNRPDTLDPAIIREGRIDKHILVGQPDRDAVHAIFCIYLSDLPLKEFVGTMAEVATDVIFGHQAVSGAMVEAIVERAKRLAMRRDLDNSRMDGIYLSDIKQAAEEAIQERQS